MNILIVDDNKDSRIIFREFLESSGYTVWEASDGKAALEIAMKTPPDLIISDILMPVMDGYQLCLNVRKTEKLKYIPFVFCTGTYLDEEDEILANRTGADGFVRKPIEMAEFMQNIQNVVMDAKDRQKEPKQVEFSKEKEALKLYSDRLVRKLEDKMLQLQVANESLAKEIAERIALEKSLRNERDKAQTYLNIAGVIFIVINSDQTVSLINKKGCEILGYAEKEIVGQNWFDKFIPAKTRDQIKATFDKLIEEEIEFAAYFENSVLNKKGEERLIAWNNTVLKDDQGKIIATLSSGEDITERRQAEAALLEKEEKYRQLFATVSDAIMVFDPVTCEIKDINEAALDLYGYSRTEFLKLKITDVSEEPKATDAAIKQILSGEAIKIPLRFHKKKDGTVFPVEISTGKFFIGNHLMLCGVYRDISERMRIEEERKEMEGRIRQSRKMEAIGTLAGGIAHDFNNILTPILGYTELMMDDVPKDSISADNLNEIYKGARRAQELVEQILTFSRRGQADYSVIQIQPIVKETLKFLRSSIPSSIEIICDIGPDCGFIKGDTTQIHEILMNLCTNANQAMEEAVGKLHVTLKPRQINYGEKTGSLFLNPGRYIQLTVSDTGCGIAPDVLEKNF